MGYTSGFGLGSVHRNAIYDCAKFIIVLSNLAVDSSEVRGELRTAIDEKKPVIPVIRAPCRVPRQLRTIQHADFSSKKPDDEAALRQLLRTLEVTTALTAEQAEKIGTERGSGGSEPNKPEATWSRKGDPSALSGYLRAISSGHNLHMAFAGGIVAVVVIWWFWPPAQHPHLPPAPAVPAESVKSPSTVTGSKEPSAVVEKPIAGPEMVVIPAGTFQIGDQQGKGAKDEVPVHSVQFSKPFAVSRFEVTFDDYDVFAKATKRRFPSDQGWGRGRRPVINVSWEDAQAYAKWLSEQAGKRYRLPTEAEWEYAGRAGSKTEYWWGDTIGRGQANCDGCGSQWDNKQSGPVGSFKANCFGLFDTAGNVWEWVEDCWHDNYNGAPIDGRAWKAENGGRCGRRVIRGGSWDNDPVSLRSSFRGRDLADFRFNFIGFRRAQDLN